jgi:hypothetical protein
MIEKLKDAENPKSRSLKRKNRANQNRKEVKSLLVKNCAKASRKDATKNQKKTKDHS